MSDEQAAPEAPREERKREKRTPVPRAQLPADVWLVEHVAQFAGKSEGWVYSQVAAGEMPHCKRGGALYFDPETVARWLVGKPVAMPPKGRGH